MTDRHGKERNHIHARSLTLLIALVLLVAVGVGATVGFLHMKTDSLIFISRCIIKIINYDAI